MKKKVLLTGAAGSVGEEALIHLLARKDEIHVRVFELPTKKSRKTLGKYRGIDLIYGDLRNVRAVEKAVEGIDVIIHLGAIIPPQADDDPDLARAVNVDGTVHLIKALERQNPEGFLLFSSSVSVYGDRNDNPWIKVDDPLTPSVGDYYAQTKIEAECYLRQSALNWSIFRLSAIFGPKTVMSPLFFHMPLQTKIELATSHDAGLAMARALDHLDALNGKYFNLSGGSSCRVIYRDLLTKTFQLSGLGEVDFPEHAFADQNFHCGYYLDADELENILKFQTQSADSYYEQYRSRISPLTRMVTAVFKTPIKKRLLRQSDPLRAIQEKNKAEIARYFKNRRY